MNAIQYDDSLATARAGLRFKRSQFELHAQNDQRRLLTAIGSSSSFWAHHDLVAQGRSLFRYRLSLSCRMTARRWNASIKLTLTSMYQINFLGNDPTHNLCTF